MEIKGDIPEQGYNIYPEALDYLRSGGLLEYAPNHLCQTIEEAKKEVEIPVIASINCQASQLWPRYANQLEEAGADALELNIYFLPLDLETPGMDYERFHLDILEEVKKVVDIPVSIKLTPQITSIPQFSRRLSDAGADALVFFNWFLEPDIDIRRRKTKNIKGKGNFFQSLRWVALLSGRIGCDICSSGGVENADGVIKQILAGAHAVQVCSLFLSKGLDQITGLVRGLTGWMEESHFSNLDDFRGELSFKNQELSFRDLGEAESFFRTQYLKAYSKFD